MDLLGFAHDSLVRGGGGLGAVGQKGFYVGFGGIGESGGCLGSKGRAVGATSRPPGLCGSARLGHNTGVGRRKSTRTCTICGQGPVIKNGTRNGRIRYRCKHCGQDPYRENTRPDITALPSPIPRILGKAPSRDRAIPAGHATPGSGPHSPSISRGVSDLIDGIYLAYHVSTHAHDGTRHHLAVGHRDAPPTPLYSPPTPRSITTDGHAEHSALQTP